MGEGATGEMAWALGVDGGRRTVFSRRTGPLRPYAGVAMRGMLARSGLRSRGLSRPGWREIAGTLGQLQAGRQAGNGMACSRAKARLNWVSQGVEAPGEMQSEAARRAGDPGGVPPERRPGRRLRVLVITVRSPRPIGAPSSGHQVMRYHLLGVRAGPPARRR